MEETVTFAAQSVTGTPSEPLELSFSGLLPGDADGNGKVTVTDIAAIIDLVLGKPAASRRMRTDVREAQ